MAEYVKKKIHDYPSGKEPRALANLGLGVFWRISQNPKWRPRPGLITPSFFLLEIILNIMGEKDYFGAVSPINQRLIAFQICFEPAIVPKKNLQKGWLKASKMAKNILVELNTWDMKSRLKWYQRYILYDERCFRIFIQT